MIITISSILKNIIPLKRNVIDTIIRLQSEKVSVINGAQVI